MDPHTVSVLAVAVLAVALSGCRGGGGSSPTPADGSRAPSGRVDQGGDAEAGQRIELTGIEIPFRSADGKIEGEIRAESADGDPEAGLASLTNVSMEAREGGAVVASAAASRAQVDAGSGKVDFGGGVAFDLKRDGASIRADRLTWSWRTGRYIGEGSARVTTGEAVGSGNRVVGSTRTGEVSLED